MPMASAGAPAQTAPEPVCRHRVARRIAWWHWASLLLGVIAAAAVFHGAVPRWLVQHNERSERTAAGLVLRRVQVDDHSIAYLEGGAGETVVLLHGFGADKDNWTRCARDLTPAFHVVAPDLPGFGESSFVDGASYRMEEQVRRLERLAQVLGLTRFHLAGNSMGGQIAGHYAVAHPERVRSLALVDCTGVRSPVLSDMEEGIRSGERPPLVVRTLGDFDRRMDFLVVQVPEIPGFVKRVLVDRARMMADNHDVILSQITPEMEALEPALSRIAVPTLVLWGDRDRMRDLSSVIVLERGLPQSESVILRDCSHVPMSERPQEFAEHYRRFLDPAFSATGGQNRPGK